MPATSPVWRSVRPSVGGSGPSSSGVRTGSNAAVPMETVAAAADSSISRMKRRRTLCACVPLDAPIRPFVPSAPFHNVSGDNRLSCRRRCLRRLRQSRPRTPPFTCRRDAPAGRSASPTGVTARPVAADLVVVPVVVRASRSIVRRRVREREGQKKGKEERDGRKAGTQPVQSTLHDDSSTAT